MRRTIRVLAAAALVAAASLLVPAPVPPAQAAACRTVTVVVDFASLGGGVATRCTGGDPATGDAALTQAGFSITWVQAEPFVCRIDGKPAADPCTRTPPGNAYWSYWHAKPGGSWVFASTGAYSYNPAPGTVEGWAFGAGTKPSVPPPAPAPSPRPTTASPRPTATSGAATGTGGHHAGAGVTSGSARPTTSVLGTKAAAPTTTSGSPVPSTSTGASTAPTSPQAHRATNAEPPPGDERIPKPLLGIAGLALVGGLGGAAWWRARGGTGEQ